jgi:hypothetical protein
MDDRPAIVLRAPTQATISTDIVLPQQGQGLSLDMPMPNIHLIILIKIVIKSICSGFSVEAGRHSEVYNQSIDKIC